MLTLQQHCRSEASLTGVLSACGSPGSRAGGNGWALAGTRAPCPPEALCGSQGEAGQEPQPGTHRSRVRTSSSCSPGEGRRVSGPSRHPSTSVEWEVPAIPTGRPGQEAQRETSRGTLGGDCPGVPVTTGPGSGPCLPPRAARAKVRGPEAPVREGSSWGVQGPKRSLPQGPGGGRGAGASPGRSAGG